MSELVQWEYSVYPLPPNYDGEELEEILLSHGANGWELVQIEAGYLVFKRPH